MTALRFLLAAGLLASFGAAHPGHGGPRLMGRQGFVNIQDLPDLTGSDSLGQHLDKRSDDVPALGKRAITPDATCGGTKGYTCLGSTWGNCCSISGWCGTTAPYCGTGCQAAFGTCGSPTSTTSAAPTATGIGPGDACGKANNGACAGNLCCSESGFCGDGDSCWAPGCQAGFGKCDADATPLGEDTSGTARPLSGGVPYGNDVYDCNIPGTIALTFDDGPDIYTDKMLDLLNSNNAKATFFVTGVNNGKGAIDIKPQWANVIKKMYETGHQLASHTWSHANLALLSESARRTEMVKLEMALRNILGFFPAYMRPPYSSCDGPCQATMKALGYHIISFDLDTDDYNNATPQDIYKAINKFDTPVLASSPSVDAFLAIAHDIHKTTAETLTAHMLATLNSKGYRAVTVGDCLADPFANWYRPAQADNRGATASPTSSTPQPPSSTSNAATGSPTGACIYKVANWCAAPLPTYSDITRCWASVQNCYNQGDACWQTVPAASQTGCAAFHGVCAVGEERCLQCVSQVGEGVGPCAFVQPTFPPSV